MAAKSTAIGLLLAVGAIAADVTSAPTFHKNVLPILQSHCQECHRPRNSTFFNDVLPGSKALGEIDPPSSDKQENATLAR